MRKWIGIAFVIAMLVGTVSMAAANTITFEDLTLGSSIPIVPGIVYPDVTFTYQGNNGNPFFNVQGAPGPPLSGNVILGPDTWQSGEAYRAVFTKPGITSVSVDMGDFDQDEDPLYLGAYDSVNGLIGFTSATNPASVNPT